MALSAADGKGHVDALEQMNMLAWLIFALSADCKPAIFNFSADMAQGFYCNGHQNIKAGMATTMIINDKGRPRRG